MGYSGKNAAEFWKSAAVLKDSAAVSMKVPKVFKEFRGFKVVKVFKIFKDFNDLKAEQTGKSRTPP